jgi:hypothetical protein
MRQRPRIVWRLRLGQLDLYARKRAEDKPVRVWARAPAARAETERRRAYIVRVEGPENLEELDVGLLAYNQDRLG